MIHSRTPLSSLFPFRLGPIAAMYPVLVDTPDSSTQSAQIGARDEEIELLHMQVRLQQTNFPEFVTNNSQTFAPTNNSIGGTCMKHLMLSLTDLVPECQAGVYCPECTELCPISVTTVIHRCLNCAETYCLLCAHEFGCCLTCEADTEAWTSAPPMPCIPDADYAVSSEHPSDSLLQMPTETSAQMPIGTSTDMLAETPAKSPLQFKIPPVIPKGKRVRSQCAAKDEISSGDEQT